MNTPALTLIAVSAVSLALGGCSHRPDYQDSTLQDVLAHRAPSPLERYVIDRPPIAAVRRNTAIIRQGSLFAILVGPDLKGVLDHYPPDVRLGVRFERQPRPHLVLERVFVGEESIDLLAGKQGFRMYFPDLVESSEIPFDRFPEADVATLLRDGGAAKLDDVPLGFAAPAGAVAEWAASRRAEFRTDREVYFVGPPESRLLVAAEDPMTLLMLDFLRFEKRPFSGGVSLAEPVPASDRARLGVAGMVEVRWIQLSASMYFRAP